MEEMRSKKFFRGVDFNRRCWHEEIEDLSYCTMWSVGYMDQTLVKIWQIQPYITEISVPFRWCMKAVTSDLSQLSLATSPLIGIMSTSEISTWKWIAAWRVRVLVTQRTSHSVNCMWVKGYRNDDQWSPVGPYGLGGLYLVFFMAHHVRLYHVYKKAENDAGCFACRMSLSSFSM